MGAIEGIEQRIYLMHGHKVMLSTELARLYGVEPRVLVQAVKRNIKRFPGDFMFKLTRGEANSLRSQIVILKRGQHIKNPPYALQEIMEVALLRCGKLASRVHTLFRRNALARCRFSCLDS